MASGQRPALWQLRPRASQHIQTAPLRANQGRDNRRSVQIEANEPLEPLELLRDQSDSWKWCAHGPSAQWKGTSWAHPATKIHQSHHGIAIGIKNRNWSTSIVKSDWGARYLKVLRGVKLFQELLHIQERMTKLLSPLRLLRLWLFHFYWSQPLHFMMFLADKNLQTAQARQEHGHITTAHDLHELLAAIQVTTCKVKWNELELSINLSHPKRSILFPGSQRLSRLLENLLRPLGSKFFRHKTRFTRPGLLSQRNLTKESESTNWSKAPEK